MQTNNTLKHYLNIFKLNYYNMKKELKTIWTLAVVLIFAGMGIISCNVTRKVTTESSFFQKGDTTTKITVKTIESYDAQKKGVTL